MQGYRMVGSGGEKAEDDDSERGVKFRATASGGRAAITWQCVAVMIILIAAGWAVVKGEWLGLIAAGGVLYVEVRSIRRILIVQRQPQQ